MTSTAPEAADLARALTERALARATLGTALAGVAVGLLAMAFLAMSSGRVDATTVPVVAIAMVGQLGGLAAAATTAVRLRQVRAGESPQAVAGSAQQALRQLALAVVVVGVLVALLMPVLVQPRGTAAITAVVGLGVLAQVVVVMTVVRRPLSRAARAPGAQRPPANR